MPSELRGPKGQRDSGAVATGFFRRRLGASERGAAAVEFALVVPMMLLLLFGIIDLGYAINRNTMVNNASREGAREGSYNTSATAYNNVRCKVRQSLDSVETSVSPAVSPFDCAPAGTKITVNVTCKKVNATACTLTFPTDAVSGGTVIVKVDYVHTWITPLGNFAGAIFSAPITVSKSTEMRIE